MRAEEVYNIAIHLPEIELERLYAFLQRDIFKNSNKKTKPVKRKLISDEEATSYILKTVFKLESNNLSKN